MLYIYVGPISNILADICIQIVIEPATGRVWQKNISLQHNLGILAQDVLGPRRQALNVTALNAPIPLHWVEQTMQISSKELGYYHQQVSEGQRAGNLKQFSYH